MENFLETIQKFKNQKILVVGDLMLDEYIHGEVNRISPEAPIPILDVKEISYVPGGGANTANNLKALGSQVYLVGVIGPEDKGALLKKILAEKGVNVSGLTVDPKRKTTVKSRVVAKNQQMIRIDSEDRDPISPETEKKIFDFIKSQIDGTKAIIISDYVKGVVCDNLARNIIEIAKNNNILCVVDSKAKDYQKYRNCDIVTPNEKELANCLDLEINNESQFSEAGKMLLSHVLCDSVLVKRGEKGMVLFRKEGNNFSFPAVNKKPRDVSGAGDTAVAVFTAALASGADLRQAVILASCACGIKVSKLGTDVVSQKELEGSLKNNLNLWQNK